MFIVAKTSYYFQVAKAKVREIIGGLFFFVFYRIYFGVFLLLNTLLWLFAHYIRSRIGEEKIALHYNVDAGIDYFGSDWQVYILPALGILIFFANTMVFAIARNQEDRKFIGHVLMSVAILSNLVLMAGLASIYLSNLK
jgi:hypothetical protein